MTFSLANRVAIVTGAAGLLGREHCIALAGAGARVVAADADGPGAQRVAAEVGGVAAMVDITRPESVAALRDRALALAGRIDVLVNNAAINDRFESPEAALEQSKFEHYPLALWQKSLDVNVTATFPCCQAIGAAMAARGAGSIINIASTYGIVAPDQSLYRRPDGSQAFYKSIAYPATKGAVLMMTRFLAAYWGAAGVRVNALSPGGVENAQEPFFIDAYARKTPLGRMAQPSDYRGALIYLASDASAYMTGANLVVDGGFTIW